MRFPFVDHFRPRCGLAVGIALLCCGAVRAQESPAPLQLRVQEKKLQILWNDTVLATAFDHYLANEGWGDLLYVEYPPAAGTAAYTATGTNAAGTITLQAENTPQGLHCRISVAIPAASAAHYLASDLFLNKELFYAPLHDRIERGLISPLTVDSAAGKFVFTVLNSAGSWVVRDTTQVNWRAPEQQTVTLLGLTEHTDDAARNYETELLLAFYPDADSGRKLEILRLETSIAALRPSVTPAAQIQLDALAAELASGASPAEIDARLTQLARDPASYRPTYRTDGVLLPVPRTVTPGSGAFELTAAVGVAAETPLAHDAAQLLIEELRDYRGLTTAATPTGRIRLLADPTLAPEAYRLEVTPEQIAIHAATRPGFLYGVQTLIQWLTKRPDGRVVAAAVTVEDEPAMPFRAMMLIPFERAGSGEFLKQSMRRFLARYKYNTLLFGEADSGFIAWDSAPELATPQAMNQETLRDCIAYARSHALRVIPLVQTIAHSKRTVEVYPELADRPGTTSLALDLPATREFLSRLFAEVVEVYGHPEYVHIGADEADSIGAHPASQGRRPSDVFADHVIWCRDELAKHGAKTILWSDLLLEAKAWPSPANSHPGLEIAPALERLPRDVVIGFWSYTEVGDFPAIRHFQELGFPVLGSSWYEPRNNFDLTQSLLRENAMGVLGTSWMYELFSVPALASVLNGAVAWNPQLPYEAYEALRVEEHLQHAMLPPQPSELAGATTVPIALTTALNRSLTDRPEQRGATAEAPGADLSLVPTGDLEFGGIRFAIPTANSADDAQCVAVGVGNGVPSAEIPVNTTATGLVFLHSDTTSDQLRHIGAYRIGYTDGTEEVVDLVHLQNIFSARTPPLATHYAGRIFSGYLWKSKRIWTGINPHGEFISLQALEWSNPHPEKTIGAIRLEADPAYDGTILLLALSKVIRD